MRKRLVLATLLLVPHSATADGLTVLTVGKVAVFRNGAGTVRVGRDPHLASPPSPICPTASAVELSSYPEPTQRVVSATALELDCARWRKKAGGFVYDDPEARGGVRAIRYGHKGLLIRFDGAVPTGPVGYLQVWLTVGATRFNARVHNFARNEPGTLVTRKPSRRRRRASGPSGPCCTGTGRRRRRRRTWKPSRSTPSCAPRSATSGTAGHASSSP